MYLSYFKWSPNEYKNICKKFSEHLLLDDLQFYYPILSLFFYYHNNKKSKKTIDIKRRFKVVDIINSRETNNIGSNKFIDALVYDNNNNSIKSKNLFLKTIPLINIIHYCTNKYDATNNLLPSNYKYNYTSKINDMNNSAYIDAFFSFIASELYLKNKTPSLAIFYGSYVGIGEFIYDATSEYSYVQDYTFFRENIGNLYDIGFDESDTMDYSVSTNNTNKSSYSTQDSMSTTGSENSDSECYNSKIYLYLKKIPLKQIILEKLDGTLEDYVTQKRFDINIIVSCFFQITFCLAYLQKHYKFTHNDLHIDNIMYTSTKYEYLYYKYNNKYFKVPTYGKIFKIIDYGRSVFEFNNKKYFSDCFSKHGEADGQYKYPIDSVPLFNNNNNKNDIPINYSFDLCRLSTTIIDSFESFEPPNSELYNNFTKLLNYILLDKNNECIYDSDNVSFQLYIDIASKACNGVPKNIICHPVFNIYNISKRDVESNIIYSLD